jgi:tetratricopeptide (TPR) repeat protein
MGVFILLREREQFFPMAIDTYAPCPGGTGKKIKFCCSDLVGDLEQLDRLIEGDQISAALDQVKRLEEKHPGRPCLMATRTKLELSTKQYAAAAETSGRFLGAFPENPLALGQAAIADAVAGRIQEAAALFDKARAAALTAGRDAAGEGQDVSPELVRIAATLIQAAAQTGHVGFAQGLVEWLGDRGLGSDEERRMLAAIVGSAGVPPALRTKVMLEEARGDESWKPDFDAAVAHARAWRLSKALTAFRALRGVAAASPQLHTNIAAVCEMLARPIEASEAWLGLATLPDTPADDAIEATGRAIALETEANPDRSPQIRFANRIGSLNLPAGEEGTTALELLEDKLRHDPHCEPATLDRSSWVARNAAPPRSAWRVYDDGDPARLLASLLIFGRQTDREPEAVLQGFEPDVEAAAPLVGAVLGCTVGPSAGDPAAMPGVTPTQWLLGSQFRMAMSTTPPTPPAAGEPTLFDTLMACQQDALWKRFAAVWPETPLPELLGKTPRQALADAEGRRRVEALLNEGEATARRPDASAAWAAMRQTLGLPTPPRIESQQPLGEVPPMLWHRLDMAAVPIDQLRGVFVTALDAGFELAAESAATALIDRPEVTPADRWEALGALAERADSSVRKLELLGELRGLAKELKVSSGMLDVAELRIRMQRGDEAEATRLLQHLQQVHAGDRQVIQALAEVLMEAGIDLGALAGRSAAGPAGGPGPAAAAAQPAAAAGKLWTPGGGEPAGGGDKKTIWTPGG